MTEPRHESPLSAGPVASRRIVLFAEDKFGPLSSKTANQAIRYFPQEVVAVIDSVRAGSTAGQVLGFGGPIPVVAGVEEALRFAPDTFIIGVAPAGGLLPDRWKPFIIDAIRHRMNIVSGLHTKLNNDPRLVELATANGVQIRDLRAVPASHQVIARGLWQHRRAKTILTVGTDCNVGKMTASFELNREFLRRGLRSEFIATGQTGILLSGRGVAVDAVPSDFIAGAIETEIEARGMSAEYFHVEGQGALTHQGYSAVTAGLLHGVMPDAMILVHHPVRKTDDYGRPLDNLAEMIELYERFVSPFKVSNIAGIAVNSAMMTAAQLHEAVVDIERVTGLPAADVLSPDVAKLADALVEIVRRPRETEKRRTKER